jgi:hypothetical protein
VLIHNWKWKEVDLFFGFIERGPEDTAPRALIFEISKKKK